MKITTIHVITIETTYSVCEDDNTNNVVTEEPIYYVNVEDRSDIYITETDNIDIIP